MQYAKPVTLNVEECDRLSFLPYLFGNDFLYAEAYVYALAQKMMPEYQGGFWHFTCTVSRPGTVASCIPTMPLVSRPKPWLNTVISVASVPVATNPPGIRFRTRWTV